jgi:tetratricopeptide (TPR) repeat protein/DNA-binding transcriptional ArsR family regulator
MDLTFFNPHSQSEADFLAGYVARGEVLDYFLRQLRLLPATEPARHHLIVAPRGYGKTSLLRRLAIAVRAEAGLTEKLIPLTFREEQHNVISLDVFWRNCLQSLAEAREDEQASEEELRELDDAWLKHVPRQTLVRDEQDGEPAWREFQSHCLRLGRRPLLLIDNVDSLLAGLPAKQHWSLRGILQQEGGPVLIAAAPRFPDSLHDQSAAFYHFFRIETLDKLSDFEVTRCLRTMAQRRGEPGKVVLELLDTDPGRIAALNTLAGGNPRTLNVLYSVLESHMSADLLSQLSAMLDTFTSWYHSRTEDLPSQARAVFDALALNWNPMTAAAVGGVTGLDTTAVSSQISRLEKAGLVEAVALTRRGKGRNGYQLSERFFNIWYLMRNGPRRTRQSIKFLAVFLQSCFSPAERRSLAGRIMTIGSCSPAYALGLAASLPASALRDRLLEYTETQSRLTGELEEYGGSIQEMRRGGRGPQKQREVSKGERKLAQLDRAIRRLERVADHESSVKLAKALVEKGDTLRQLRRLEEAVEPYDRVSARYADTSDSALREQVARALVGKGIALRRLGRFDEALECHDAVLVRFGETIQSAPREQVARALFGKGITLAQVGDHEQAVETYDDLVARFGDAVEPALCEWVIKALLNKGYTLGQLGRHDQAINTYDDVVTRFGDAAELVLLEEVANVLVSKGSMLARLGRHDQAINTYDDVVARFGDAAEPLLRDAVARALINKGSALRQLGGHEQAVETYDNLMARFGDAAEPVLRELVAKTLINKGSTLRQLGRHEQAVETYDTAVSRFGDTAETALREVVARALVNKGHSLGHLGRHEQAAEIHDTMVSRFGDAAEPTLREQVARALFDKGGSLRQLGRSEEVIETYDGLLARFSDATEPALREQVARALFSKGVMLEQLGRHEQAVETYDDVVARFGDATEPDLREAVAKALVNKGHRLGHLGRHKQAVETYDAMLARCDEAAEPALREQVAQALVDKAYTLAQLGQHEQAIEACEGVLTRFGDAPEPLVRELVDWALLHSGASLLEMGQPQRAAAALHQAATAATTGALRATAWNELGNLLLDFLGDPVAAITAFESGEAGKPDSGTRAVLHANCAFALILHGGDPARARDHLIQALADDRHISLSGRHMLGALRLLQEPASTPWPQVFDHIGLAVESGDTNLTSNYLGGVQRLLWFTIAAGEGGSLHRWMDQKDYAMRYAPLYYAIVAAIEGEDLLLQINPETRPAAVRIHKGIARMLKLYGRRDRKQPSPGRAKTNRDANLS